MQVKGQVQLRCFDSETLCVHSASSLLIPTSCVCGRALVCMRLTEILKCGVCVCVCVELCEAAWAIWEKSARFTSLKCNPPEGDIRCYFYSMTPSVQEEPRNLSKYAFSTTTRRNQSHKNRALNRVPLNRLLGLWRNGLSTAERALRGHAVFTMLQLRLNKVMLHFQPVLTTVFFFLNDTWYPDAPQRAPLPPFSWRHTWRGVCVGGGWEMDEWCCGGVCEGSDARVAHLCPATAHDRLQLFVAVCVSHSTWLVTVRGKVSHIFLNTLCYRRSHMEPSVSSASVIDFINFFFTDFEGYFCFIKSWVVWQSKNRGNQTACFKQTPILDGRQN